MSSTGPAVAAVAPKGPEWVRNLPSERRFGADQVAERLVDAPRVVVLDDDPTGTQTVRGVPVLTRWRDEDIRWALDQDVPGFFVLTNTRSLSADAASSRNREVAEVCLAVASELGIRISFASRSDSTLRGHFPLETDVLSEVSASHGMPVDGILLSPAYLDAGRITLDGIHWLAHDGGLQPAGDSEFARDATFGYRASRLADWVEEKSAGRIRAADVAVVTLSQLRGGDLPERLDTLHGGAVIAVDAVNDDDLRLAAAAVLDAEAEGRTLLYRVGPSFVRARLGQSANPPLTDAELATIVGAGAPHGLIVVGSHVGLTSRQLARLVARRPVIRFELDVAAVLDGDAGSRVDETARRAASALADGIVIISTSRELRVGADREASLEISRRVSSALTETVRRTVGLQRPGFVIAKGGITSSDVATEALGIDRAWVRGSLLPGIVSLWQTAAGDAEGLPYIVFAGNVGDDESLADVVDRLEKA